MRDRDGNINFTERFIMNKQIKIAAFLLLTLTTLPGTYCMDADSKQDDEPLDARENLIQLLKKYAPNEFNDLLRKSLEEQKRLRELREEIKKERAMQNSARAESGEQPAPVSTPAADVQNKAERDEAMRVIGNIMSPVQTRERVSDPLVGDYTVVRGGGCLNWVMFD
jgi:hypothetical protein